jgi:hypothetical protein
MPPDEKTCFVIAPIGDDDSETRQRSDKLLKHVISPVVSDKGYDPIRADQIAEPGLITSQIIQHVAEDALVIADLTERNPNVFYELAIRHALRRPLVQMISHGERIPFDVAGMRTIEIDIKDLDSVERAKQDLSSQIDAVERNPGAIDTPIAFALDLQNLRQSGNPEERSLAELVATVSELRSGLASIERRLADPEELFPSQYFDLLTRASRLMDQSRRDGGFARNAVEFALERIDEAVNNDGEDRDSALTNAQAALREVSDILA